MGRVSRDYLQHAFRHFRQFCEVHCPLYVELSSRVADEPAILDLASHAQDRQPPVNLLFGAVHFLLLAGRDDGLAPFYRSVGGRGSPEDAWPFFVDFCARHADEIVDLVASQRVQTNEVGRCGLLLPAFATAQSELGRPLSLIEIGASAGLNLLFDRYAYRYGDGRSCGGVSSVVIRTEIRGSEAIAIPNAPPAVIDRVGVDIAPVDVTDERAMRWVEALIWPDELDRLKLQRRARSIAMEDPPRLLTGDGADLVSALVDDVPESAVPCVFHSHVTCQMSRAWRTAFAEQLDRLGRQRDMAHVSLEWLDDEPGPQLRLSTWNGGARRTRHLAECHHHGRWMQPMPAG